MNYNLDNIRAQLKEVRPELMKRQHVTATGIGYKTVGGRITPDLAIICSVEIKKPMAKLSREDIVPPVVQGVPTDVKPVGILRALQDATGRFRPAPGGSSIGHFQITAGTFGCLVKKENELYILSNNHVLANSNEAAIGDAILQPGPYDGGNNPADHLAMLSEFIPIYFEGDEIGINGNNSGSPSCGKARWLVSVLNTLATWSGSRTRLRSYRRSQTENKADCAIAKPLRPEDVSNEILGFGAITGILDWELGIAVKKSGRTTGLTNGTIEQIDVSAQVSYGTNKVALFTDQLMAGAMSQGGDSGSAVLNEDNKLVGLLFAGSETTTIINRIGNVFDALGVALP